MAQTAFLKRVEAVMTMHDSPPMSLDIPEGNTQSFIQGSLLVPDGAGQLVLETSPSGGNGTIYGVAHCKASRVEGADLDHNIWLADDSTLFEANLVGDIGDSTTPTVHVLAQADFLHSYDLILLTTGIWVLDFSSQDAGNKTAFVHVLAKGTTRVGPNAIGDTNARVLFTFNPAVVTFKTGSQVAAD